MTRDHGLINQVLNAPEVIGAVCPDGVTALDAKGLDDGSRIFLKVVREQGPAGAGGGEVRAKEHLCPTVVGVFVLQRTLAGVFEVHTCLLNSCRGAKAVAAGKLGVEWMFLHTDATRLYSLCPDSNPASMHYAFAVGFHQAFHRAHLWLKGGKPEGATVVELTVQQWAYKNADRYRETGQAFHKQLHAGREDHHGEDVLHDGMLGVALQMGGVQPFKAQELYNTWAVAAGYAPGQFKGRLSNGEQLVDIAEALITYHPGTKQVGILKGF